MKDRFDLEQEIIRTSEYASQIRDLIEFMVENSFDENSFDEDKILNVLIGIAEMIDIHTDKMYNVMCEALELNTASTKSCVKNC